MLHQICLSRNSKECEFPSEGNWESSGYFEGKGVMVWFNFLKSLLAVLSKGAVG